MESSSALNAAASTVMPAQPVDAADLGALTEATTFTTVSGAPRDPAPAADPSGGVVHPTVKVAAYASPGGPAVAAIPVKQLGTSDTWLPVVGEQPGWIQVLLPARPNNSTAWLAMTDALTLARTPYQIKVDRAAFRLTLMRDGQQVAQWTVGIGKPSAITPPGRTFILASIKDQQQSWSPVVLPLGAHSDTHLTYGGGPGTVAVHTWPTDVYGQASSDGCIRVPPDALNLLSTEVPLGTPVLIR
ncbi:hypothetical protein Lesp02_03900 [Lentzea sp. NBRC 105346]|nr:hypothetical protein Lesp02_03900 [Lentzea sp. NBRC 105346]